MEQGIGEFDMDMNQNRSALGMTIKIGEVVKFDNGLEIIFKKVRSKNSVSVVILAPPEIRVLRMP